MLEKSMLLENSEKVLGRLWIVAAPSGGGKTSLVEAAVVKLDKLVRSISFTTRKQRVGEIEGKDYNFVDTEDFEKLIANKAMLEYELVFGNYYGTSLDFVNGYLSEGIDVILTIDWQGSRKVRENFKTSKGVFILPPNINELESRLRHRGQDSNEIIAARMADAKQQASHYNEFDYLIINDDFEKALDELITIIKSDRLLRERQEVSYSELISELL